MDGKVSNHLTDRINRRLEPTPQRGDRTERGDPFLVMLAALREIHRLASRSPALLHPTREFANRVARVAQDAIDVAEEAN